jgi:hypothetical protein
MCEQAEPYQWFTSCKPVGGTDYTVNEFDFEAGTKNCPTTCGTAEIIKTFNFTCYSQIQVGTNGCPQQ